MKFIFSFGLSLIGVTLCFADKIDPCSSKNQCSVCSANADCQWCALETKFTADKLKLDKSFTFLGACVAKTTSCKSVQFGTLKDLALDFKRIGGIDMKVVTLDATSPQCTSGVVPQESAEPSCETCIQRDPGVGWCQAGISAFKGFIDRKGGVCIKDSLSFLCNANVVPALPPPFGSLSISANYISASQGNCKDMAARPPAPKASSVCEDNYSCRTCHQSSSGCSWCGGKLTGEFGDAQFKASMFGLCVSGSTCEGIAFGDTNGVVTSLASNGVSMTVSNVSAADPMCTNVEWPAIFAKSACQDCLDAEGGWCKIKMNPKASEEEENKGGRRLFKLPTKFVQKPLKRLGGSSPKNEISEEKLIAFREFLNKEKMKRIEKEAAKASAEGALCLQKSWSFLCTASSPRLSTSWGVSSCPK